MRLPLHTTYTLVRDTDQVYELDVWYQVSDYTPAHIAGDPNDSYPAEGGNIIGVEVEFNGEDFELTADEEEAMIEDLEESHYEP